MKRESFFTLQNFGVWYDRKQVVSGISLDLQKGQSAALLGLNGSGKTTLLKAICGLLPSSGSCSLNGHDPRTMRSRQRATQIAYIAQRGGIEFPISSLEVVLMGFNPVLRSLQRPSAAQKMQALEALGQVGLADLAHNDFTTLSEGQRQLVILARALVQNTPLLLLDEPDSALDFPNRHMVLSQIQTLLQAGEKAVVLSMHDANFALQYCERLFLLQSGRLLADLSLEKSSKSEIREALSSLYGAVDLLEHGDHYIMVKEEVK